MSAYEKPTSIGCFLFSLRETLLYGLVIFVLLTLARRIWHLTFADSLFEIWAVSTILFAPLVWAVRHLFADAFKWTR
jgi:hypothetical protein